MSTQTPAIQASSYRAAVEKANQGVFVSSKAVREWFASLGTNNELPRPKPDVF